MAYLLARDTISGQEARAYIKKDGKMHELFYAKRIDATIDKEKLTVRTLGKRGVQSKSTGWQGSGNMTIFYATSFFRRMIIDYIKTGKDVYFDLMVTNEDPSSTIGKQTVMLYNCNINSVTIAKLDSGSEVLDESVRFTFDDADILAEFKAPAGLGG